MFIMAMATRQDIPKLLRIQRENSPATETSLAPLPFPPRSIRCLWFISCGCGLFGGTFGWFWVVLCFSNYQFKVLEFPHKLKGQSKSLLNIQG